MYTNRGTLDEGFLYPLTGTALSWYILSNDIYKQDWPGFVKAFKKHVLSQETAYFAQVEALNLAIKDNESVRHFAIKG